ncbi:hypothetical protein SAMN02799625_04688 [Methylobacterium sp. UNC300MFChir4.1]|uniref:hypothetical protein n=1 Tax=Methylobacterium sp. UNC300MFChir4.1 TaxID=1502747 RepID=UPI0008B7214F|nr:hypothetical protein [Methylobacterium sp. UNC300MFChir4.1]SEP10318.1 hypothetical protein SAMN02799625_04688 [Methylobacterium sp. UNC300MFChir4.1]
MNTDQVEDMHRACGSLMRQRDLLAKRIGGIELAPVSMAEDLSTVLLAIEAVDRALADAGHPYFDAGN